MPNLASKYQIPLFVEFFSRFSFPDAKSKHTAEVAMSYYVFAYYQMIALSETYTLFFKKESPSSGEVAESLNKSWSHAFAMYALLRTCLEALSIMRKMLSDTDDVDETHAKNVKKLIDIANDVVKHPTFKLEKMSEACEPQALSLNGEIDVVVWSELGYASKIEIDPIQDFYQVHNYIEYLSDRLLKADSASAH